MNTIINNNNCNCNFACNYISNEIFESKRKPSMSNSFIFSATSVNSFSIDLTMLTNIRKINAIKKFKKNWNGVNGASFSKESIDLFVDIIKNCIVQPEIAPTGRGTLLLQFDIDINNTLYYELGLNELNQTVFSNDKIDRKNTKKYKKNFSRRINEKLREYYAFK